MKSMQTISVLSVVLISCVEMGCRSRRALPEQREFHPAPIEAEDVPVIDASPSRPDVAESLDAATTVTEARALQLVESLPEVRTFAALVARRRGRFVGSDITQEANVRCATEDCRWNVKVYEGGSAANIAWRYFEVHPWTGEIRVLSTSENEWLSLDQWRAAERDHK